MRDSRVALLAATGSFVCGGLAIVGCAMPKKAAPSAADTGADCPERKSSAWTSVGISRAHALRGTVIRADLPAVRTN
uniref:Putative secreted protein n=1 Tax=Ixodes ricinus TaxID=34613 RepID=A0A6B0U382_IXORI